MVWTRCPAPGREEIWGRRRGATRPARLPANLDEGCGGAELKGVGSNRLVYLRKRPYPVGRYGSHVTLEALSLRDGGRMVLDQSATTLLGAPEGREIGSASVAGRWLAWSRRRGRVTEILLQDFGSGMPAAVVHTAEAPPPGTRLPSLTAADGPWVNRRGEVLWRETGDGPNGPATRQRLVLRGTDGAETEIAAADAPERFVGADLGAGRAVYSVGRPDSPAVRINASEIAGDRERVLNASAVAGRSPTTSDPELATPRIDGRLVVWHERVDTPAGARDGVRALELPAGRPRWITSVRDGRAQRRFLAAPDVSGRLVAAALTYLAEPLGSDFDSGQGIAGVTLTAVPAVRAATR